MRFAVIGDIHGHWSDADADALDGGGYDAVLVVGDLAGLRWSGTLAVARGLARLRTPTLVVPGNHDATHPGQLLAEVAGRPRAGDLLAGVQRRRVAALREAIGPATLAAYSLHRFGPVTVVAGRPHSMGGPTLSFPGHLAAAWGVPDLDASAAKLCALVDAAETEQLVFLAHNGPSGLGATRDAIWGCDFRREQGDWGDPDLEAAIDHARATGRRVRAVVAGHMHRRLRGGGRRAHQVERSGTLYVNAAAVPRVHRGQAHHVELCVGDTVTAEDRWLAQ